MKNKSKKSSQIWDNLFIIALVGIVTYGWCSVGPKFNQPNTSATAPSATTTANAQPAPSADTGEIPPALEPVKDDAILNNEPIMDEDLRKSGDAIYDDEYIRGQGDGDCASEGGSCENDTDCCDAYCVCYHGTCQIDSPKF